VAAKSPTRAVVGIAVNSEQAALVAVVRSSSRVVVTTCLGMAFILSANSPSRRGHAAEKPS
jgi:hypothetical protein